MMQSERSFAHHGQNQPQPPVGSLVPLPVVGFVVNFTASADSPTSSPSSTCETSPSSSSSLSPLSATAQPPKKMAVTNSEVRMDMGRANEDLLIVFSELQARS